MNAYFLMSHPSVFSARNGTGTFILIVLSQILWHGAKLGLISSAGGGAGFFAGALVMALFGVPTSLLALSLAVLAWRDGSLRRKILTDFASQPGVARIDVFCAGHFTFWGPFAHDRVSTALILAGTDGTVPHQGRFGAPIPVLDPAHMAAVLSLEKNSFHGPTKPWKTDMGALISGKRLPEEIAEEWRAAIEADEEKDGRTARAKVFFENPNLKNLGRIFDADYERSLKVVMTVDGLASEPARTLGAVVVGGAVRDLAGARLIGALRRRFGRPSTRPLPLLHYLVRRSEAGVKLRRRLN